MYLRTISPLRYVDTNYQNPHRGLGWTFTYKIFGTTLKVIDSVNSFLSQYFEMKDLGELMLSSTSSCWEMKTIGFIFYNLIVEKVLSIFGYSNCETSLRPYDPSVLLWKNQKTTRDQLRYSQIIGSQMYLASVMRLDISFAVSELSRLVSNLRDDHWHPLKRVVCDLKGAMSYDIHYTAYLRVLKEFSDSNWISGVDEIKATRGYFFTLGGGVVSWMSRKQIILTRSAMKAELATLEKAIIEAEWLHEILIDFLVAEKNTYWLSSWTMTIKLNFQSGQVKG